MPSATFHGTTIAQTDAPLVASGYVYFPHDDVRWDHLEPSPHTSRCIWKGQARYYHVVVDGQRIDNAAWCYPDPKRRAGHLRDHVAFWKDVQIQE